MQNAGYFRATVGAALVAGGIIFLSSCVTTTSHPQQFRTFFVPPARAAAGETTAESIPDAPPLRSTPFYSNELPGLNTSLPNLPRPTDTDFLIKTADDRFAAGKRAVQEGRLVDARREFNRSIEILLGASETLPDRARVEQRLETLVDAIYRYDVDQSSPGDSDAQVAFDKSPLDDILGMTFPVDPNLRNKVSEQVQATASQLPLEESDAVISYINFFSSERGKKILTAGLRRAGRYKPMIERILAQEGVPQELIFVAQAESGFLPRAVSNKLCVGVWQFAKFRGNEYGLNQTPATDDRMDPEKATRAAAHHLHDLYTHFGDWNLALAAYNCGPGCVDRAVARSGYADFWNLRRLNVLPKETSNYVPVILAMTIMSKNAQYYGVDNLELDRPLEYDTLELEAPTHLALIADAIDRPLSELRDLNPALLRLVGPSGFAVRIPKGMLESAQSALAVVPSDRRASWRIHRVDEADTAATLAKRFGIAASLIGSANQGELPAAGSWIAVPVAYAGDRTAAVKTAPAREKAAKSNAARRSTATGKTTTAASVQGSAMRQGSVGRQSSSVRQGSASRQSSSLKKSSSTPVHRTSAKTTARRAPVAKTPAS